jgi:hypothetical protein
MDSEWSLLHRNPLLPELNLPTKKERYVQNRTVQLRAECRKTGQLSFPHPVFKNKDENNPIWSVGRSVPSSYHRDVFLGEPELDSPVYRQHIFPF